MATEQATSHFRGRTAWARNLGAPVRDFLNTETGGAVALLAAAVAALIWANSPWPDSYESVWTTKLSIQIGHSGISQDLRSWVNNGRIRAFTSRNDDAHSSSVVSIETPLKVYPLPSVRQMASGC